MTLRWKTSEPESGAGTAKFLPLLRQAVAAAPHRPDLKLQLARALFRSGQTVELIDRLKPALADHDAPAELLYWLGRAAMERGDDALALVALRSAAAKGMAGAFDFLTMVLARLGRDDETLEAGFEALKRTPIKARPLGKVATALCNRGEIARLWRLCIDLRARGEHNPLLSAILSSVAAMRGDTDEVEKLIDRAKWFVADRLPVPDDFNRKLAAEILAEKSAKPMQGDVATRGTGWRINNLERVAAPHVQDLMGRIRAAVDKYAADRESFRSEPFMMERPAAVTLNSWSLAAHEDGHTAWHIHPRAWMTGVYYVEVPELKPAGTDSPGAIEFGPFPLGDNAEALKPHRWRVMPEPGMLLLFPSYFAHRSVPTGVAAPRISIALDVLPWKPAVTAAAHHDRGRAANA